MGDLLCSPSERRRIGYVRHHRCRLNTIVDELCSSSIPALFSNNIRSFSKHLLMTVEGWLGDWPR